LGVEGICLRETFTTFLHELEKSEFNHHTGKELLEKEVVQTMHEEGFSEQQILQMPLNKLLELFYDAYLWKAKEALSKSNSNIFI
jgi:hypothetical protein